MSINLLGSQALENARKNPARHWSSSDTFSVKARLSNEDYFTCFHSGKFKLNKLDKVFTVGSCFARNIENVLSSNGIHVLLSGCGLSPRLYSNWNEETQTGGDMHISANVSPRCFNKYDTMSMLQEFKHVLTDDRYENEGLIELQNGLYFDPFVGGCLALQGYEQAVSSRKILNAAIEKIREANLVFITLGLTESWYDTQTGMWLNEHPGLRELKRNPDRFEFRAQTYDDVYSALQQTIDIIRREANPSMRFILTVSPVTLWMTFMPTDVLVSNTNSKAILRAVAGSISEKYDYVDYFPSFEMVMNTARSLAWLEDQHHVAPKMVSHIMNVFKQNYFIGT